MSTLKQWRKALEEQWEKVKDNPKQYYHAEMMNLLEDAEREVATAMAKEKVGDDQVIKHTLKGGVSVVVPEALSVHTLVNLLRSLPLPTFHHITKMGIESETERGEDGWKDTGKYNLTVEWEEYLSS